MRSPEHFMREAVREAARGADNGLGKPFGAVVAHGGEIVGRGCNSVFRTGDPSEHAEMAAMRDACKTLGRTVLNDCELYATGQPCLMCLGAIFTLQVPTLYYANSYADAEALGYAGGGAATSLGRALGFARGAFGGDFVSGPALAVIRLPLPEALDLYARWKAQGKTL